MTRFGALKRSGGEAVLPELIGGEYLLEAFLELGLCEPHPMGGEMPLSWLTLDAYARVSKSITEPWEYRTLRQMSVKFINAKQEGASIFAVAPIDQEEKLND